MIDHYKFCILGQFEAALWMLHDCIQKCPPEHWAGPASIIAKYEFWHVVHHTLACTDYYLSPSEPVFHLDPKFYPAGQSDFEGEFPSRQFSKAEMIVFLLACLSKLRHTLGAETETSLQGHCGFPHHASLSRGDIYLYTMRHVMHHVGQLSALLRKAGHAPSWGSRGWRDSVVS